MPGQRFFLRVFLSAAMLLSPAAALAQTAEAANSLAAASKMLQEGKHSEAVERISAALKSGKLDNALTCRGLLLRGEAYEKLGKPALALADFANAQWLEGLSNAERLRAAEGRKRALSALSLASGDASGDSSGGSGPADKNAAKPPAAAAKQPEAAAPRSPAPNAKPAATAKEQPQPAPAKGAWRATVHDTPGGGSSSPGGAVAQPRDTRASSWTQGTAVTGAVPKTGGAAGGQVTIHLATVATEEAAKSEAKRISAKLGELLEGQAPEILRGDKNGAAVFKVVAGPYDKSRSADLCAAIKAKGISCLAVARK